ncbi:odorant receptor 46a-like [Trichogramma pretiosum]|uniref:odorant receptor 46a-like n=1 Tax=Trichogramma pretiosum TaxID=7493 RepID=UPI000C7196BD|nr:odorant receptor 46a-like [Trichogramma pretiosum]
MIIDTLNELFTLMTIAGAWRPLDQLSVKYRIYTVTRFVLLPLPFIIITGMILGLILNNSDKDEMYTTLLLMLTVENNTIRAVGLWMNRKHLVQLLGMLASPYAQPRGKSEIEIEKSYSEFLRKFLNLIYVWVGGTWLIWVSPPFFQKKDHRNLPLTVWLPHEGPIPDRIFWWLWIPDAASFLISIILIIGHDISIATVMSFVSCQFDLLAHRVRCMTMEAKRRAHRSSRSIEACEKEVIVENVNHHRYILEFADLLSKGYGCSMIFQFSNCFIQLTANTYLLASTTTIDVQLLMRLIFLSCMFLQSSIYCYFGDHLTNKSRELTYALFTANWMDLCLRSKKDILFMTARTMYPVYIGKAFFIVLSLNSFVQILRISYGVFNVLRQT